MPRLKYRYLIFSLSLALLLLSSARLPAQNVQQEEKLAILKGDRISILGNTLADRMQHDGWLETYFQSRFPKTNLAFRNLGFSGDEIDLRLRSRNFGSPDEWLSKTKTDVIFAFFGYNESFAGKEGLQSFRNDLESFIKKTLARKYNGESSPRLVLFSPIAYEDLQNPNLPDGKELNQRLALYASAMADVAKENRIHFVDLFSISQKLYADSKKPLTINGIHLNTTGNEEIARAIDQALFKEQPERSTERMEKIRQAVKERNFYWFNRYRTVDGYSIYGGRAGLRFVKGQTNRVVMQREMEILDVMTANRDKKIWAVAQGNDNYKVDDSNTPPFIPVVTNRPGKGPGGKHLFLGSEEAIKKMSVPKGMKVTLFAGEEEFPELVNPVQMAFDTKGRLWVAAWPTYPHWKPKNPMNDKLLIFEDTNGDGKADKMKVFADDLHNPTGFEFWNGGVLVAHAPDVFFLKDTDGDDKYDVKVRVLSGIDSADTHHTANSFTFDPGGALYFQEGTFHHTQVETPWRKTVRSANAGVFRYEPRSHKFGVYVNFGFANPHGHVFDRWGQDIVIDGTGAVPYHGTLFSGQTVGYRQRHSRPPTVYKRKTRPCPGLEILSSRHFPKEFQGNLLVPNVIGFLGILRYKLEDRGASFVGIEQDPILKSTDPNFRPADLEVGPDGAIYFTDWQNPIIGHMQHNLRDPSRDTTHGRIYKITNSNRTLLKEPKIDGASIDDLLELLKEPEDRTRYRTRIELTERDTREVIPAINRWVKTLNLKDAEYEHHLMEALWLHQNHNVVNQLLLKRMQRSSDFRARAAATRVLCYWRDRVKNPLALLQRQINDSHPRVRLEAIRALSFFHDEKALAVAVELLAHPDDNFLRYTFNETLNTLEQRLGSRLNRGNLASSLLSMLKRGTISEDRKPILLETICRHGGKSELGEIWQQTLAGTYDRKLKVMVLGWLEEAATTRRVQPNFTADQVQKLLGSAPINSQWLSSALQLAAAWEVRETADLIQKIAENSKTKPAIRFVAIDALADLGGKDNQQVLANLTSSKFPTQVRFKAAVALAQLDLDSAAKAAAMALAAADKDDDPALVVEGFLNRKKGADKLAANLEKQKVSPDTAKRILRAMYLAGRNHPALGTVAGKLAGINAIPKPPTPEEVELLTKLVAAKGNPMRGQAVFRRADLGCLKCHAINKAGGDIGPDLGPLGTTSPVDYVIRSILDPSNSIKEEYLTKVVFTSTGHSYQGIVVRKSKNELVLKDATGKLQKIPTAEIEDISDGKSLMPEGITRILTKDELIDLISFVSKLGKPGPFRVPAVPTIHSWRVLRKVPKSLQAGIPNRDEVRDILLRSEPEAWEEAYSLVNGTLPLGELAQDQKVLYLQGELQVVQGGPVELNLDFQGKATIWIDEEEFEQASKAKVNLKPGRHRLTVRVEVTNAAKAVLKMEVRKPENSNAAFELVRAQ